MSFCFCFMCVMYVICKFFVYEVCELNDFFVFFGVKFFIVFFVILISMLFFDLSVYMILI